VSAGVSFKSSVALLGVSLVPLPLYQFDLHFPVGTPTPPHGVFSLMASNFP